ncbi:hypothetical protein E3P96_00728 [Wallemia ichthyophaga]|nr:hypothetical protein E3P96_00728 [Wallemia ichthyophaga]
MNVVLVGLSLINVASARNCYYVRGRYRCSGLSRGGRIGIGVAVAVAVVVLIGLISLLFFCRRRKRLNQQGHVYEQQMYAPNQQNYPVPQMPYNQGGYGYNPPPGPPPGMDDHQPPPTKGMAAIARRRIVRRDAKKTAPIVIIILLIVIVVVAWLVGVERKRRRKKREYEAFVKSLPVLEQPNVATGIDVGNTHGQSPLDFINERYFGRDNHFSSAQRHFDDFDDEISPGDAVQGSTQSPPVHPPPAHTNQPPTPTNEQAAAAVPPPPSYTDSNNNLNIPPPSYNR